MGEKRCVCNFEIISKQDEGLTFWLTLSSSLGGRWMLLGVSRDPVSAISPSTNMCRLCQSFSGRWVPPARESLSFLGCVLLLLLHLRLCLTQPCPTGCLLDAWVQHLDIIVCLVVATSAQTACTSVATSVKTAGVRSGGRPRFDTSADFLNQLQHVDGTTSSDGTSTFACLKDVAMPHCFSSF